MAYVNVPKDLNKVKNKILFNMTKRQLICLAVAFVVGVPFYFLTKGVLGTGNAATGMVMLMLPAFLFAMYEKDGMYLEQILKNMIRVKFLIYAIFYSHSSASDKKISTFSMNSSHFSI